MAQRGYLNSHTSRRSAASSKSVQNAAAVRRAGRKWGRPPGLPGPREIGAARQVRRPAQKKRYFVAVGNAGDKIAGVTGHKSLPRILCAFRVKLDTR
jgi:hypothetical protein